MRIGASIKYGTSYVWPEEPEEFPSIAAVIRELDWPGSVTGHPHSYYPCAKDWSPEPGESRATVAFLYSVREWGIDTSYPAGIVTVGPRGGFRVEPA